MVAHSHPVLTNLDFEDIGMEIIGRKPGKGSKKIRTRRFKAWFGAKPFICAIVWSLLSKGAKAFRDSPRARVQPEDMLMGFHLLKTYSTLDKGADDFGVDPKTYGQWSWYFAKSIANLDKKIIRWEHRKRGDIGNWALTSVDGIHFKIDEPAPFSGMWKSHKYSGSALGYEVVVNIMTGDIVGYNGPFPAGSWPDIKIFRNKLRRKLGPGEKVVGDQGYKGDHKVLTCLDARDGWTTLVWNGSCQSPPRNSQQTTEDVECIEDAVSSPSPFPLYYFLCSHGPGTIENGKW